MYAHSFFKINTFGCWIVKNFRALVMSFQNVKLRSLFLDFSTETFLTLSRNLDYASLPRNMFHINKNRELFFMTSRYVTDFKHCTHFIYNLLHH